MMRSNGEKTLLTDYIGKASNKWVKRLIPLTEQVERLRKLEKPQTLRLQILGKLGRGHKHYIAIDDIQYEKCPVRFHASSVNIRFHQTIYCFFFYSGKKTQETAVSLNTNGLFTILYFYFK